MSKMQEKYLIMEKIFPKEETILKDTNIIPMIEPETKEKTKTLKVLSFETEQGVFIRGKMIDIDNIKEIKKKFYPLGYGELIKENRKKIRLFPFENIRDIKDKDPYKWSKENGNMLNQEKIGIRRLYTRKLTVIAAARKEIENEDNIHFHKGNSRLSSVKNLGFSVENYEKNLEKSFEPSFKMKKQKKSDKTQEKKVLNLIPLVFGERIKEKTNS